MLRCEKREHNCHFYGGLDNNLNVDKTGYCLLKLPRKGDGYALIVLTLYILVLLVKFMLNIVKYFV